MKKEQRLLAEMASVGRMCRGKVSVRRQGKSGGEYFVLQCWHGGANRCRYVHPARRKAYEEACERYRRFMSLAESYADIVIARTEKEIANILHKMKICSKIIYICQYQKEFSLMI